MTKGQAFEVSFRVRYAETDAMGVAHHSAYIPWFELARIEALRDLGHSYADLEQSGVMMPVIDLQVAYRRSVRFDDEITLRTLRWQAHRALPLSPRFTTLIVSVPPVR